MSLVRTAHPLLYASCSNRTHVRTQSIKLRCENLQGCPLMVQCQRGAASSAGHGRVEEEGEEEEEEERG